MKILILGDPNSIHTIKWVKSLHNKGVQLGLFGLNEVTVNDYQGLTNLKIATSSNNPRRGFHLSKIGYLTSFIKLRKFITQFKPDIVHAHYLTSYGLLGYLANHKPFIVSAWGSDIFEFPRKNILFKILIKALLKKADIILSTSRNMAEEISIYTNKPVKITPFGVDIKAFSPRVKLTSANTLKIGVIKTLEPVYGIKYLIQAFSSLYYQHNVKNIRLVIVGDGSLRTSLKLLANELNIADCVEFVGKVDHQQTPVYHNSFDIEVIPSLRESFGVSAVEAMACGNPVIVTDVGGLPEVVEHNSTGIVVPPRNSDAIANAIIRLMKNSELRVKMGKNGRNRVKKKYDWEKNVQAMICIYNEVIKKRDSK